MKNQFAFRIPIFTFVLAIWLITFAVEHVQASDTLIDAESVVSESNNVITLDKAIDLALKNNPELAATSIEILAADATALQEGLIPNPEVEFEVEDFGGTDELSGFDGAGYSLAISQTLELGGKHSKRSRVASLEKELAEWDFKGKQLDIICETTKAFTELLGSQERLALVQETHDLAVQVHRVVSEQVFSGKVSPLERIKAEVEMLTLEIELEKAERELVSARKNLVSMWGSVVPDFEYAEGTISSTMELGTIDHFISELSNNPDITRWNSELLLSEADLAREKSLGISDLTISGRILDLKHIDSTAYAMGISFPLPLFDRNQGATLAAKHSLDKTIEERDAAFVEIEKELSDTFHMLLSTHLEVETLKHDVLPLARKVFEATQEGYRFGKFDYLEVLDAQRTYIEVQGQYVDAQVAYHRLLADLDRITGKQNKLTSNTQM